VNSGKKRAVVRAYAKVNLTLDVLGKRSDGFHDIESVMQTISLHDTITLSVGGERGIRMTCDMPEIPTGESNLAYKAVSLFFEKQGVSTGLDIRIEKCIPPEAGFGGGSSDAAAVLRGLSWLLKREGVPKAFGTAELLKLMDLAAQVGSDVPFFLVGGTALVRGRGEDVIPLPDIPTWWLVIVKPPFGVSTAWAYSRLDEVVREKQDVSEFLPSLLHNDLELPAVEQHPEIAEIKEALLQVGAQGALMCGSGSAVFGLFEDESAACAAMKQLCEQAGDIFVAKTITRAEALELD
jgi:4-diphosphocytidyl-2-C-methyl-D-erythritol kinase